jgi:hypothetical protein
MLYSTYWRSIFRYEIVIVQFYENSGGVYKFITLVEYQFYENYPFTKTIPITHSGGVQGNLFLYFRYEIVIV